MKIRLGVSGFLGVLGLKILGIPGLIAGLFTGMLATRSSSWNKIFSFLIRIFVLNSDILYISFIVYF